ncbi:hypothetical protein AMJ44_08320 [candidate division WOR-1 bacterium DG_54_3]|uniref:Uncharacterized protein n=1 Tax=candidate division WOR-1 bacterium DG_54_3 TaxID=1703775 RepID=A0A0S7XVI3_UNCSA|nr:MAG: hypothetical protein AMJ44_08320 [candidate division WOR-1 bacterium DG_54_3]
MVLVVLLKVTVVVTLVDVVVVVVKWLEGLPQPVCHRAETINIMRKATKPFLFDMVHILEYYLRKVKIFLDFI